MTDALSPSVLAALTRIGIVLAHFVWQGAAIALVLALLMRILRTRSPGARYTTLATGLMLLAASPIITLRYVGTLEPSSAPVTAMSATEPGQHSTAMVPPVNDIVQPLSPPSQAMPQQVISDTWKSILAKARSDQALCGAAVLWAAGVLVLAFRLTIGWLGLYRLRLRGAEPMPSESAALVGKLCDRLGLANVRVFATRAWGEPVAFGLLRPVVLVPISVLTQCPPELVEAIIAHELAHIRRYDLWVNLLQRIIETLLFYHPAVWWVSGRIRAERELCCDDLAVSITQKRADYASALVEISRIARGLTAPPLAAGLIGSRLSIVHRARRVLSLSSVPSHSPRVCFWIAGPLALVLAGTIGLLAVNSSAAPSSTSQPSEQTRDATSRRGMLPVPPVPPLAGEARGENRPAGPTVVRPLADGIVLKVLVLPGQEVKAGAPIIQLDDAEIELELRAADSKLDAAKEAFDDAQREMKAGAKPYSPAVTRTLEQEIKMAEIEKQRWALRLARTRISSPAAGKVVLPPDIGIGARIKAGDTVAMILPPNSEQSASTFEPSMSPPRETLAQDARAATESSASKTAFPLRWYAGPESSRDYEIRSGGAGFIAKVHAKVGAQVKAGELIAELDNDEIKIELEAAKVHLDSARRQLDETTQRIERGLEATSERNKAQETAKLAELDLKRLELRLARTLIRAPLSGKILGGVKWNEGITVQPGEEVTRIRALPASQPAHP